MADLSGFNAEEVEPQRGFDPIPNGEYFAVITESEEKENAKKTGSYVKFTFEILEGEFKGRKLWVNLNLNNPNAQAVDIARQELSSICRAVGVMRPNDSSDLHDIPMLIKVKVVKRADTGELQNEIAGYKSKEEAKKKATGGGGNQQKASQPSTSNGNANGAGTNPFKKPKPLNT